ncbi:hypothetical protein SAMN04487949_0055 [Halogranum gelatinilyticum]|uniref:Uncharacterized protein n=1 Tax=Halogranum gelatinilyticum TaxID=660521 RepID=A0A1G9NPZ9_9EURY|nr:hypothetical protein [Halogranum gelatinilyticum]SDL88469.1 hypothetical protein SAMN04487949_0055 [Halogranum gelatinilyticum]
MSDSAPADADADVPASVAELRAAHDRLETVEREVDDLGESTVERVADAHRQATKLLDNYADSATGSGDFKAYLQFQNEFIGLVDELPEDIPHYDAFETASDRMDKRRLSEGDFAFARETLEPAAETAELLADREDARDGYSRARRDVEKRLDDVETRLDDLERLQRLGDADLDAPVDDLREPIVAYNDAVRSDFQTFRREASARDFFDFLDATTAYPLVDFETPPDDLRGYVDDNPAGEESVAQLLDYADYSASKLSHYVEDASALKTNVAVHRTYLERLDATPLTVEWPPAPAEELRYRVDELVAVVGRFASEETVAQTRELRDLTTREDYERLRTSAEAREQLTDEEREQLASGAVEEELSTLRTEREQLQEALETYPRR